MYVQFVYENSVLGSGIMAILNRYVSEILAEPVEIHIKSSDETLGFSSGSNQDIGLSLFETRKAMLLAERRKAEALKMLRLKEMWR